MTTIAFKDGVLAGDTLVVTGGQTRAGYSKKVHRLEDGRLASYAGAFADCYQFIQWLTGADQKEPDWDDLTGLVVTPDGLVLHYDHCSYPHQYNAPWFAIGSGAPFARGAMEHGASAIEAVEVAIQLDVFSGGAVDYERLDQRSSWRWPVRLPLSRVNTLLKRSC